MKSLLALMIALGVSTSAMASGFRCYGDDGYTVYLKNESGSASRTPELLRIRYEGETLLEIDTNEGEKINKTNHNNVVRYTVKGGNWGKAMLQIRFKEGRETLGRGESAPGQLVLYTKRTGEREVYQLECVRWLTN